jgi:transcriptional regulator with XRE-family HTH domain
MLLLLYQLALHPTPNRRNIYLRMSEKSSKSYPFKTLGVRLKSMRVKLQQSIEEVSGAVEIDDTLLAAYEQGSKRPSEDILMLLISYFSVKEEDAVKLWELAGYTKHEPHDKRLKPDETVQPVLVMPMDVRVVYTDMANITTNKYGVTMNFMQSEGPGNQPLAVSRVGMSREHALKLLTTLQKALTPAKPKMLPAPESKEETDKKQQ